MGLSDYLDKAEHVWDKGKELVGKGIDKGTDAVADVLDKAGAHGWADKVENTGDRIASELGATPGEQQLGETDDPKQLVHGDPAAIRATAKHLRNFHTAFDEVGQGMRKLDSSHWKGEAAETFREKFAMHPAKWLRAADACEKAAGALETYADTVAWAQGKAKEAVTLYQKGVKASEQAVKDYNKRVDAYNAAVEKGEDPGPRPGPFTDPGKADVTQAQELLQDARRQRDDAAGTAARSVRAALAHAPAKPSAVDRLKADYVDSRKVELIEAHHVLGGVFKGAGDLVGFVRGLNPNDAYNLTHPTAYAENTTMTLAGLAGTATHPERAVKTMYEDFRRDPSEFGGRMLLDMAVGDGAGLTRFGLRTAVRTTEKAGTAGLRHELEKAAEQKAEHTPQDKVSHDPDGVSHKQDSVHSGGTDPINLATGKMYLPQTDVDIPGALPLVVKRRVESGYHFGR